MSEKKVQIQPLGERVLVLPDAKEEKTKGGLIIPQTAEEEKASCGTVIKLGTPRKKDYKFHVKEGDRVLFKKYSPEEVKIDEVEYLLIDEADILAII